MASKDIHKDGIYMPTEVGKCIYVWSAGGQKPQGNRGLVITSHGMDIPGLSSSPYIAPNIPLYFYCPHGMALPDNQSEGVMTRKTKWFERVPPGTPVPDYLLTKAQGSHSRVGNQDHETYGHIQIGFHRAGRMEREQQALNESLAGIKDGKHAEILRQGALADYRRCVEAIAEVQLDVATIRHRRGFAYERVTLFSLLTQLKKSGFNYSEVHCYFCRGAGKGHEMSENTSPLH
jgi:hypothetical protein